MRTRTTCSTGNAFAPKWPRTSKWRGNEPRGPPGFSSDWQAFNVTRARKAAEELAPAERLGIRKKLLGETYNINTILDLQDRYQVSDEESYVLIDRICELTSESP